MRSTPCADVIVFAARQPPPSTWEQDITLFKSVGVAFQDIATAKAALDAAVAAHLGLAVDMDTGEVGV